jgi:hypothetical protein
MRAANGVWLIEKGLSILELDDGIAVNREAGRTLLD